VKRLNLCLLGLSILLITTGCSCRKSDSNSPITFKDSNLELAVRGAINKPEGTIYVSDVENLKMLNAANRGISDISGLQYFVALTVLELGGNNLTDRSSLSSIKKLPRLSVLNLGGNQITDIAFVASLAGLDDLLLSDNLISDISPLANLKQLKGLDLTSNKIVNISALKNLDNLKSLILNGREDRNQIADISPLSSLKSLQTLFIQNNRVSDVLPLLSIPTLTTVLILEGNPLNEDSINKYIPELKAKGVKVM
jgi:internalin A